VVNTQRKADVEAGCPTFSRSHARGDRRVKTEFNGDREESKSHGAHRIGAMAGPESENWGFGEVQTSAQARGFEWGRKSVRAVALHKEVFEVE